MPAKLAINHILVNLDFCVAASWFVPSFLARTVTACDDGPHKVRMSRGPFSYEKKDGPRLVGIEEVEQGRRVRARAVVYGQADLPATGGKGPRHRAKAGRVELP